MSIAPIRKPLRTQSPCPECGSHHHVGYVDRGRWKSGAALSLCWRCHRSWGDRLRVERLASPDIEVAPRKAA